MTHNIRAVDPETAWQTFLAWAPGRLKREAPGTAYVLLDYQAVLRRARTKYIDLRTAPAAYLAQFGHVVQQRRNGLWQIDGELRTSFQTLHLINLYRAKEGLAELSLEDLRLE